MLHRNDSTYVQPGPPEWLPSPMVPLPPAEGPPALDMTVDTGDNMSSPCIGDYFVTAYPGSSSETNAKDALPIRDTGNSGIQHPRKALETIEQVQVASSNFETGSPPHPVSERPGRRRPMSATVLGRPNSLESRSAPALSTQAARPERPASASATGREKRFTLRPTSAHPVSSEQQEHQMQSANARQRPASASMARPIRMQQDAAQHQRPVVSTRQRPASASTSRSMASAESPDRHQREHLAAHLKASRSFQPTLAPKSDRPLAKPH